MPCKISNLLINRMGLIDDDPHNRDAWSLPIEDLDIEPVLETGPISDVKDYIDRTRNAYDAVLCDHHLKVKNQYSVVNGAELVSEIHKSGKPAMLCTRYGERLDEIRRFRKYIPVWLNPDELNDIDKIAHGLEICINELKGNILPSRKLWRALIRFEDIDNSISDENPYYEFTIPSWDQNKVIRILGRDLPDKLTKLIEPEYRCHVYTNLGAVDLEDVYFDNWEVT